MNLSYPGIRKMQWKIVIATVLCFFVLFTRDLSAQNFSQEQRLKVVLHTHNTDEQRMVQDMELDVLESGGTAVYVVAPSQFEQLQYAGVGIQIVGVEEGITKIDAAYHSYEKICALMDSLSRMYPSITHIDTVGFSQRDNRPILGMKISDNAHVTEDEPAVFFDGQHHASEPVSMECCLALMDSLLKSYGSDARVTGWINSLEIWIVPCWNPDSWKLMVDTSASNFSQRRNLRDNNLNGRFDASTDGVNLNRNYDLNWSGGPASMTDANYRGPAPFSEKETQGKRDLALAKHFVLSLTYHSAGETVYYLWTKDGRSAPDQVLIKLIADSLAVRIPKYNRSGHYSTSLADCGRGCSDCWMYGIAGAIEYTVETSDVSIPPGAKAMQIARDNITGARFILDRMSGPGLLGHVTHASNGQPLPATVRIRELADSLVAPRICEPEYGRYERLLLPGVYTIEVSLAGFETRIFNNVVVRADSITLFDIQLTPIQTYVGNNAIDFPSDVMLAQNYPNPFNPETVISYKLSVTSSVKLVVYDLLGREVAVLVNEERPSGSYTVRWNAGNLPSGVYVYRLNIGKESHSGKMILQK